jgi:hypothetical protein
MPNGKAAMAESSGVKATIWVACIECHRPTSHEVVERYHYLEEDNDQIRYTRSYNIIRCAGCRTVSFAETYGMNDECDEYGYPVQTVTLYPSRTAGRKAIEAASQFPSKVLKQSVSIVGA